MSQKICDNLRQFATIRDNLRQFATIRDNLRQFATIRDNLRQFAIIRDKLRQFATTGDTLQHLATILDNFATIYIHSGTYRGTLWQPPACCHTFLQYCFSLRHYARLCDMLCQILRQFSTVFGGLYSTFWTVWHLQQWSFPISELIDHTGTLANRCSSIGEFGAGWACRFVGFRKT